MGAFLFEMSSFEKHQVDDLNESSRQLLQPPARWWGTEKLQECDLILLGDMFSPAKWCQQVEVKDGHLPTNKWWAHLFKIYVAI